MCAGTFGILAADWFMYNLSLNVYKPWREGKPVRELRATKRYRSDRLGSQQGQELVPELHYEGNCRARKQFPYHNLVGPPTISQ